MLSALKADAAGHGWRTARTLPDRIASTSVFDAAPWLGLWHAGCSIETVSTRTYVCAPAPAQEPADGHEVLPIYLTGHSPFWFGYERYAGVAPLHDSEIAFAGSTYSMYTKRGPVRAELIRGAWVEGQRMIREGAAGLLVVPNLTAEGVESWVATVGEPSGRVLLDRTYHADSDATYDDYLARLDSKIRRDVARRLRRASERGLTVDVLPGPEAEGLVDVALALTVGTTDEHSWPALYDAPTLHAFLRVEGAVVVAARVADRLIGVFFGFLRDDEVAFLCGGVDYGSLRAYSTYVALMYRGIEWAHEQGIARVEWGRDNYAFKARHGLTGIDLWALVYEDERSAPRLREPLERMHARLTAYIRENGG
jgi:hypothetical protein